MSAIIKLCSFHTTIGRLILYIPKNKYQSFPKYDEFALDKVFGLPVELRSFCLKIREQTFFLGLIEPSELSIRQGKISRNTRIWFDRKNFYYFGTCLENVDLARLIRLRFNVCIHLDSSRTNSVSEEVQENLKEFYGARNAETLEFVEVLIPCFLQ